MRYRKITPTIWRDKGFRCLTNEEKLVAFYLLTAQSNRVGLFYFSSGMASEDLATPVETLGKRIDKVCQTLGWGFDKEARVLWIPSGWVYNTPENPNVLIGNLEDLSEVPQNRHLTDFWGNKTGLSGSVLATFEERSANVPGTFPKPSPQPMPNQEQEQEQEQTPPNPPPGGRGVEIEYPIGLDTDCFRASWDEYTAYRREHHLPVLKPISVGKQLERLALWGPDRAIAAINHTIANGYQGIVEPKEALSPVNGHPPANWGTPNARTAELHSEEYLERMFASEPPGEWKQNRSEREEIIDAASLPLPVDWKIDPRDLRAAT